MTEEQMRLELIKIETEWDMCGLSDEGLYADYAIELAKRAVAVQREEDAGVAEEIHDECCVGVKYTDGYEIAAAIRNQK
jgi:hypothetical protein